MVKARMWSDAKEFYTKGIAVLTDKSKDKWEHGEDVELEAKKERELQEQSYTNRALCHLELSASNIFWLSSSPKKVLIDCRKLPINDD
jgi:hypothetical protein